jgi:hypothetical protein
MSILLLLLLFKNKILEEELDSKCWLCTQHEETIDHLTSGSPILVKNEYLMGHKVCAHLHYSTCAALGVKINGTHVNAHAHTHKPVCEDDVTIL